MSDYNQLNKSKPEPLHIVFSKNKEVNDAILVLVETAYLTHHKETKERSKKLVECLEKQAKVLLKQLQDDSFKDKLLEKIEEVVSSKIKISSDVKKQIQTELTELISQKINSQTSKNNKKDDTSKKNKSSKKTSSKKTSSIDTLNNLLNNKSFISKLTSFSTNIIKSNNKTRIKTLSKVFNTKIGISNKISNIETLKTHSNNSKSLANIVTGGFGKLVEDFIVEKLVETDQQKSPIVILQQRITSKIRKTLEQLRSIKKKIQYGFGNLKIILNPKNLLKIVSSLTIGIVKIINKLIFGLFKGIFSLVKNIFKLGLNIVKGVFSLFKTTIKSIIKISKFIISGLAKLTVGFFKRIKKFIFTPAGMYVTGFIIGYVAVKIKGIYNGIKEKIEEVKKDIQQKFHKIRMNLFKKIGESKLTEKIQKLSVVKNRFFTVQKYMIKSTRFLRDSFKNMNGKILEIGSGLIGAWVGRLLGSVIGGIFTPILGPLAPVIGSGLGTALGYIAGKYIGEALEGVPEKTDAQTQKERNILTSAITNKYKEKKQKRVNKTKLKLNSKIEELGDKINSNTYTDDQKKKLIEERQKYIDTLEAFNGKISINDENEQERNNNERVVDNLTKMLMLESEKFHNTKFTEQQETIFSGYNLGANKLTNPLPMVLDDVFDKANKGNIGSACLLPEVSIYDNKSWNNRHALLILSILKSNAIQKALDAYQKGIISFSDLKPIANMLLQKALKSNNVNLITHKGNKTITLDEYFSKGLFETVNYIKTQSSEKVTPKEFNSILFDDMQSFIQEETILTETQENIVKDLTNRYIEEYKKVSGKSIEQHREIIRQMFQNYLINSGIKNKEMLENNKNGMKDITQKISDVISMQEDNNEDNYEEEKENFVKKCLIGLKDALLMEDVMPQELNDEFERDSTEQLKKINIEEKKKTEKQILLDEAKNRNSKEIKKYRELTQKLIKLQGGLNVLPVQVNEEKDPSNNPNIDSGIVEAGNH